ncbi:hypothetical protein PENFLA_c004G08446 [Penicillium flavigenum]|uniref:Amine oxidase n=1 Tax=Penicillium flavigenum TaxID=254877 RepID=A0A1V6TT37_9EURO|nr:hypothetical protein PENFLA_c004G08446 [Penicillium flavigenum]
MEEPCSACVNPHPFASITASEIKSAVEITLPLAAIRHNLNQDQIAFKSISLKEPPKSDMVRYLELEHAGKPPASRPKLPRRVEVLYYIKNTTNIYEEIVCLDDKSEFAHSAVPSIHQGLMDPLENRGGIQVIRQSKVWADALKELGFNEDDEILYDAWPHGADKDTPKISPRYLRAIGYVKGPKGSHAENNRYAFPLPISPVVDILTWEMIGIDPLPTAGIEPKKWVGSACDKEEAEEKEAEEEISSRWWENTVLKNCRPSNFFDDLQPQRRKDVKPIVVTQPEGVSFTVKDASLVEWQKWSFRVSFNFREGMVVHDVRYDNRSLFYRLSLSEMTVPYGDPRPPYHTKQAFDVGDAGAGALANTLRLGCDCLGSIYYFHGLCNGPSGQPIELPNVICLHEEDNGISWKHTNDATHASVSARSRVLILQTMMTVGNYDYIMAWKFDEAANISYDVKATGILSTHLIDSGKVSPWGNVVAPGIVAQNHQHLFCLRIDTAIDGYNNTVQTEECHPLDDTLNIHGNAWEVRKDIVEQAGFRDANPLQNRVFKIINENSINPHSKNPVGYKFMPPPSQMLLAHPSSVNAKRAKFAQHHVWVTQHQEGDLWAGGKWTTNSSEEIDGISKYVAGSDSVRNDDVIVWITFGMTHSPRVEEFPIMPTESLSVMLKPADFFTQNPALDMPQNHTGVGSVHIEQPPCH